LAKGEGRIDQIGFSLHKNIIDKKEAEQLLGLEVQQGGEEVQERNSVAHLRRFMFASTYANRLRQV
jgi:hypothetical protein